MSSPFTLSLSPNYKWCAAKHRKWQAATVSNGESWPRLIPQTVTSSSDIYRVGIIPTFVLTAPTTSSSGTSTPGTYGIVLVYRSSLFNDGFTGDNIQSNRSNIQDVTLTSSDAAVLTKVTTSDTKVNKLDVYAAIKISGTYGTFYRVVKDGANSAGTITFNIQSSNGTLIGAGVSNGTADTGATVLATDNDFPYAQPIQLEVNGRLWQGGGITKRVTATFTNGSGNVTVSGASSAETFYDGIEFWYLRRDSDSTGGVDGRGTYLARYSSSTQVTLVNADGTADTYDGTSGSETTSVWTEPNRRFSKYLNPHAFPEENISNDYPTAILAAGKVPNTNRILIMGKNYVIAEDYDRLPLTDGVNYISTEFGCSSHFSIVEAHGRLYWLDFGGTKREICVSDGSTVQPISTQKIKTLLERVTLDSNADVWRVGFIHGAYYKNEDTIRWGLYMDNNSVPNFVLELDLNQGDSRSEPVFYAHRYLDVFTYGNIRGRVFLGQYGWSGGNARLGVDNVAQRFRDWVPSGTLSGELDTSGQSTTVLSDADAAFVTAGIGLQGIQVLVWQESTAGTEATLITNPTYYHCRISANTATTFTVNYVETCNAIGEVQSVGVSLPSAPSGSGWNYRIGVIQAIAGPKWLTSTDGGKSPFTVNEVALTHKAQNVASTSNPIKIHCHANFDTTPADTQYAEAIQEGQQTVTTTNQAHSRVIPKVEPSTVFGFTVVDNNCDTGTEALNIETIVIDMNEKQEQDDASK